MYFAIKPMALTYEDYFEMCKVSENYGELINIYDIVYSEDTK